MPPGVARSPRFSRLISARVFRRATKTRCGTEMSLPRRVRSARLGAHPRRREGSMPHSQQPARLGGSTMGPHNHVCAFFQSREEEYELLLPFIAEGFERGERA